MLDMFDGASAMTSREREPDTLDAEGCTVFSFVTYYLSKQTCCGSLILSTTISCNFLAMFFPRSHEKPIPTELNYTVAVAMTDSVLSQVLLSNRTSKMCWSRA